MIFLHPLKSQIIQYYNSKIPQKKHLSPIPRELVLERPEELSQQLLSQLDCQVLQEAGQRQERCKAHAIALPVTELGNKKPFPLNSWLLSD